MIFIDSRTDGGKNKGKVAMYCRLMEVSRQGFYYYLLKKDRPYKYEALVNAIREIISEDEYNDTYGRIRMYQALKLRAPEGVHIPCRETVRKVMRENNLSVPTRRRPNGITKADREAQKSENLIERDFTADQPLVKGVTDITEVPGNNGKLYVSGIFDCFDSEVLGLSTLAKPHPKCPYSERMWYCDHRRKKQHSPFAQSGSGLQNHSCYIRIVQGDCKVVLSA